MTLSFGSIRDWSRHTGQVSVPLPLPDAGHRKVQIEVATLGPVEVTVSLDNPDLGEYEAWPLGVVNGTETITFSIDRRGSLDLASMPGYELSPFMIRHNVEDQVVPESEEPTLTNIEPREVGPAEEVRRLLFIQNINQAQREAQLLAEWEARWAERDDDGDGVPNGVDPTPSGDPEPVVGD